MLTSPIGQQRQPKSDGDHRVTSHHAVSRHFGIGL